MAPHSSTLAGKSMDRGAWWAAVSGVAQSQPQLKRLSSSTSSEVLVAQTVKRLPTVRETRVRSLGREHAPGEGNGNPLQYSCLENPMKGGEW